MKTIHWLLLAALAFASATALAQGSTPTDPQIAAIVVAANQADIDAGTSPNRRRIRKTSKRSPSGWSPTIPVSTRRPSISCTSLASRPKGIRPATASSKGAKPTSRISRRCKGHSSYCAYIDHEVTYHEEVIDALDKTLIPSAQNAELKALLVKVRPTFVAHLDHAKRVQASLANAQ